MEGKVWLVGAGPGDRGLFTLKGLEVLREAEVVVYDALVGDEVLTLIPENAKKINVGKRAGRHTMAQEEINRVLLEEARKGFRVVRLKGGDPFVFGRGGEELELLSQNGIPFEVVPGVTSAFAVPAYNGIPVTHRDFTSSVHVITGHRRKKPAEAAASRQGVMADSICTGCAPEGSGNGEMAENVRAGQDAGDAGLDQTQENTHTARNTAGNLPGGDNEETGIDFEALVRLRGTLIFLMGVSSLSGIMDGLLRAGIDPGMPAAVLEKGTTSKQRRIAATVSTLTEEADRAHVEAPAIIIVGDVCRLADEFAWYDRSGDRPLAGKKILVTRPRETASQTADRLRRLGAEVLELPAIETVPIKPNPELEACFADRSGCPDWLVFTSPTGVRVFMDAFLTAQDVRTLGGTKIAVIGEGSRKALLEYGLRADFMPSVYDGETLGRELARRICEDRAGHVAAVCENDAQKDEPAKMSCEGRAEHIAAVCENDAQKDEHAQMSRKDGADPVFPVCNDKTSDGGHSRKTGQKTGRKTGDEGTGDKQAVRILIPRAAVGNRELIEELKKAGNVEIRDIPTYDTVYSAPGIVDARAQVRGGQIESVVFTSASTVRGFCASMGEMDLSGVTAICIGRQTAAAAGAAGMKTKTALKATLEALIEAVVTAAQNN